MDKEIKNAELADFFISHSPNFVDDLSISDIDDKHRAIVASAYAKLNDSSGFSLKNFRSWEGQSDLDSPVQLSK